MCVCVSVCDMACMHARTHVYTLIHTHSLIIMVHRDSSRPDHRETPTLCCKLKCDLPKGKMIVVKDEG